MKSEITAFAFGARCGVFGARGLPASGDALHDATACVAGERSDAAHQQGFQR
jgi:hypothetical protein